jgi:F-type H+-transporting ATPase subunit b
MAGRARWVLFAAALAVFFAVVHARAQGQPAHDRAPAAAQHGPAAEHGPGVPGAGRAGHAEAAHGAAAEHAGHAEHDENAPPPPINWWHGLLGEKDGVEPSLLWREPGEPPPFLASLINFGVLVFIAVKFGKAPLQNALVKRKENIVRELEDARRLREAAEKRLAEYEAKLGKIHEDLERVHKEFREQGELDKQRILAEAKERRDRMKRDAEILLSQEVKQLRQDLVVEVVREATRVATEVLSKEMTLGDHDRFAEMFLAELRPDGRGRGSGALAPSAAAKGSGS